MRGKNRLPRRAGRNSLEFCSLAAKRFVTAEPTFDHERLGHEPQRGNLKYRCPAQYEGWECPMSERCNAGKQYGLTVRAPREIDLRRFPALPRATPKFERLYKRRPAVERVNARLKIFWGADDGHVTRESLPWNLPEHRGPSGKPRPSPAVFPPFPPHRNRAGTDIALGNRTDENFSGANRNISVESAPKNSRLARVSNARWGGKGGKMRIKPNHAGRQADPMQAKPGTPTV